MLQQQQILQHASLYRSGSPFRTEAVILDILSSAFQPVANIPRFEIEQADGKTVLRYALAKNDGVYGLGEQLGGLNKRGKIYKTYNIDISPHQPHLEALYGSHPFLFVTGDHGFGVFIDYPSEMTFDIGHVHKDVMEITIPSEDFDLYLFESRDPKTIIRDYLTLTGSPYIPPKWAFGYQQCRYSYPDAESIQGIADKFRSLDIPCDAIGMDIDYMVNYKDFSLDEEKFPRFTEFTERLKQDGFRLVPILDAGVKIEQGYSVFEEGKAKGYFCMDADGKEFVAAVWPGLCHFPDFQRTEVRAWWGQQYKFFTDMGIEGFWNDMNEPAIFYVPDKLKKSRDEIYRIFSKEDVGRELFDAFDHLNIFNHRDYFKSFTQRTDDGQTVLHDAIHNLYAFNMTRGTAEQLERVMPEKRYFLLSRGSYAGLHRFAGIWTGDNSSWWEHLEVNIHMLMSLNMAGFLYTGADIGGFGANPSPELMIRWMQLGVFSPLFRNHTWFGARQQEPWSFDDETTGMLRNVLRIRYALLPYSYSEYVRAAQELRPFIAPLFLEFSGERVRQIEDQFLLGESLMIAPIYTPNARGRFVHLPECRWLCWKASRFEARQMDVLSPGDHFIAADLAETPVFLRENRLLVMTEPMSHVYERPIRKLLVTGLVTDSAEFTYYEDDGLSYDYRAGKSATLTIRARKTPDGFAVSCDKQERNGYALQVNALECELYNADGESRRVSLTI